MLRIKNITVILTMLVLFACIKTYNPRIDSNAENKYVVSGRITDKEGWQEVEVSLSSPIESPGYLPGSGCQVKVLDDKGNIFLLEEHRPGLYRVWIDQKYLISGTSYQVRVTTPEGDDLVSGFDRMSTGPKLDSVYYFIKDIPTTNPDINLRVMQFYIDLNAVGTYSQYYKWEVDETWEYETARFIQYYYDGVIHKVSPPDYSKKVCWITKPVNNIFTISMKNLTQNTYYQYPLHSVDGHTSRLGILYSMMVRQFALSEGAFNYWEQLRINSNEQGGLYEKQPLAIKGNLQNVTNPKREVLGYFYAVSESSKRYFYHDVEGIDLDFSDFCSEEQLGVGGWKNVFPWEYPKYFYYNTAGQIRILADACVDCRKMGGTTVKPDFWPR